MHFTAVFAVMMFFPVIMGYEGVVDGHCRHLWSTHNGAKECPSGYHGDYTVQCCVLSETQRQKNRKQDNNRAQRTAKSLPPTN